MAKILIVDDDPETISLLETIIQKFGHQFIVVDHHNFCHADLP